MAAKILVVDDEIDLQELIRRKFRREIRRGEFDFEFANDGVDALEKIKDDPDIELVISDINMPRMDGLTLLEHMEGFEEQLKTIIISAYGDMDNIRAAMNRGAFDFVTKPIDFQDLQITIKKTLDQLDLLKEAIEHRMAAERARANLTRYFPPHLAEILATRDEPFGLPLLRSFHGRVEGAVFEHDGTLDNYIGDEVMATFGVPDVGDRDACNALDCAQAILDDIGVWNAERVAGGELPVGIGIGLNFGSVVLGDTGSERSMAFTVIGDTVNTASRLERLTRIIETDLVVSEALIEKARQEAGADQPPPSL